MTTQLITNPTSAAVRAGLPVAFVSAVAYGLSGPVGRSLLDAGWSSSAVALARIGTAALVLIVPTVVLILQAGSRARGWAPSLLGYGMIAIAGAQLCFFTAIQYAPVSSVLLIEYLAPVLLIFWTWARTRQAPAPTVLLGASVAVAGLATVIGVVDGGGTFNVLGTVWGFGAALCLTAYFAMAGGSGPRPPAVVLTGGGMIVGTIVILVAGALGIMPIHLNLGDVRFAGHTVSFAVPVLILGLVCAVAAYLTGIVAVRRLGTRVASFVSLSEVIFALSSAWLLLGEQPGARQGVGGLIVLVGIIIIGLDADRLPRLSGARQVIAGAWWTGVDVVVPASRSLAKHTVKGLRSGGRQLHAAAPRRRSRRAGAGTMPAGRGNKREALAKRPKAHSRRR